MYMQIFIKSFTGKTITLNVESTDTVLSVKKRLAESQTLDITRCKLMYCGNSMYDGELLGDHNIQLESTIHLLYRLLRFSTTPTKDVMTTMNFIGILPIILRKWISS